MDSPRLAKALRQESYRDLFPRLEHDIFLNAAGGSPLSSFSEEAVQLYLEFWKHGGSEGRDSVLRDVNTSIRREFAALVGAEESEIGLVHCTKEGEQIVLDGLNPWNKGGNVVTNVFHFSGSLHNYVGHQKAGRDVRIVRSNGWDLEPQMMLDAIDEATRLVSVTLLSNVNGRIEDVKAIADRAHEVGAYVYADIIQAAGIYPVDLNKLNVDFAACSSYKWLFGPHGVGFLYVRKELQGSALSDRLYPGHVRHLFPPWSEGADEGFSFSGPVDARRYEPGHHGYLGYAAVLAALRFIREAGVEKLLEHCVGLNRQLLNQLDLNAYLCISPLPIQTPIIAFENGDRDLIPELVKQNLFISVSERQMRISPGIYNNEDDINRLAQLLNRAARL